MSEGEEGVRGEEGGEGGREEGGERRGGRREGGRGERRGTRGDKHCITWLTIQRTHSDLYGRRWILPGTDFGLSHDLQAS